MVLTATRLPQMTLLWMHCGSRQTRLSTSPTWHSPLVHSGYLNCSLDIDTRIRVILLYNMIGGCLMSMFGFIVFISVLNVWLSYRLCFGVFG